MLTYKSNGQSVLLSLSNKIKGVDMLMDKIVREVALTTLSQNQQRVFNKGIDANDKKIGGGSYSTERSLATENQFTKKSAFHPTVLASGVTYSSNIKTKKVKSKKFAEGDKWMWIKFKKAKKAVPVMVLEQGYKELRQIQGKETSHVNLQYSGLLFTKLMVQGEGKKYKVGFEAGYGSKIAGYLEGKYKKEIWGVTPSEEKELVTIVENRINDHLRK